ncbi:hypothetical protein JH06_4633 [Blastocystis sp. subtype 4]|uniref:hypothetical protein n=1 Tax=Blastocystis sp. subtype 4 TaxID=944170 RepID=UPI0007119694|nr:hypothetical protein JH06_4633 [Blastocystis sp. subtype 4]KNB41964.1 hypothetical protein JH06_4633 [Blastocystis sp. subtype 4]|eukprot:XP_014525407.1 hypothetical protein JH06_4633 [Blastocystis sp. subtype 4]
MLNTTYSKQIGHMYRMHYRHLLFFTSITIVLTFLVYRYYSPLSKAFTTYVLVYSYLSVFETFVTVSVTMILTSHRFSPSQLSHLSPFTERVVEGITRLSSYRDLSYSDVACGVTLNTIIWHHKRDSGYDLEVVKNMCVHEYLEYIRTHPKPLARHPTPQLTISEKTKNELIHYVEYANAIYGVTFVMMSKKIESTSLLQRIRTRTHYNSERTMNALIEECGGELILNVDNDDIGVIPWLVAYDYAYDSVVIVIRGTATPTDFFTDMITIESVEDLGREYGFDGHDEFTHGVGIE